MISSRQKNKVLERTMLAFKASDNNRLQDDSDKRGNEKVSKFPDNEYYLNDSIPENIDTVILAGCDFKEIFGKTKAESPMWTKRLPVVKIAFKGKTIYRRYYGTGSLSGKDKAALNYSSLYELVDESLDEIKGKTVQISKGCRLPYYWNHPFHATRISFRLGLISIIIAVVSLLLSIFCNLPIIQA